MEVEMEWTWSHCAHGVVVLMVGVGTESCLWSDAGSEQKALLTAEDHVYLCP
jgi:hypothetical protein